MNQINIKLEQQMPTMDTAAKDNDAADSITHHLEDKNNGKVKLASSNMPWEFVTMNEQSAIHAIYDNPDFDDTNVLQYDPDDDVPPRR